MYLFLIWFHLIAKLNGFLNFVYSTSILLTVTLIRTVSVSLIHTHTHTHTHTQGRVWMSDEMEASMVCMCAKSLQSCLTLCDPMTVACTALLSMGLFRQEYWSGMHALPPPENFPHAGIKPECLTPALAVRFFTISTTWEVQVCMDV